jgi:hypothetical protein
MGIGKEYPFDRDVEAGYIASDRKGLPAALRFNRCLGLHVKEMM